MVIPVIVADDHPIILDGLAHLIAEDLQFELVARCVSGDEALEAIRRLRPALAVVDLRMPGLSGLEVLREVQREKLPTRVVLLTAEISDQETLQAVRLSVGGIVLKAAIGRELLQSLRLVAAGGESVDQATIRGALHRMMRHEAGMEDVRRLLTPRELELVPLVAEGLKNREIAAKLNISESTVKIHLYSVYQKLGVSGRVELSNYAREKSLI